MIDRSLPENFQNLSQTLWAHDVWDRCYQCFFAFFLNGKDAHTPSQSAQGNPASLMTSWTEGLGSPVPTAGRLSSKDTVKARAAVQARMALHSLTHAASARPCRTNGTSWARALARAVRNCAVSTFHLPPRRREPPVERGHPLPQAQGKWFPSCAVLPPRRRHRGWRP